MNLQLKFLIPKVFEKLLNMPAIRNSDIDKTSKICSGSYIVNSTISRYTYVGKYSFINDCEIGSFCSIANDCKIGGAGHPINWVSTSPVFHRGKNVLKTNFSYHYYKSTERITIGHDVWIGNNCIIKSGVKIGHGAIVGMGSVVTKDIEPYSIVGGNPAKEIRKRFEDEVIKKLLEIQWWNFSREELQKFMINSNNITEFISDALKREK